MGAMSASSPDKVNMRQIAELADVSQSTVSRVLNNRNRVNPETRRRILDLVRETGMRPQAAVRRLVIAVVTEPTYSDRVEGYAATLTNYLAFALSKKGASIFLPEHPVEQLPSHNIDGIIAVTYREDIQAMLKQLETRVPVVYMDHFDAEPSQYVVRTDHYGSGYLAAKHLITHGAKHPSLLGGNARSFSERLRGFEAATTEAGFTPHKVTLDPLGVPLYQSLSRQVRLGVDGMFVPGANHVCIEALHLLTQVMRLRVPDDMSLIGTEIPKISEYQNPPLCSIFEPLNEMADRAVEMVLGLVEGSIPAETQITLPVSLLERESVPMRVTA